MPVWKFLADDHITSHTNLVRSPLTNADLARRIIEVPLNKSVQGNEFVVSIKGRVDGARAHISEIEFPNISLLADY
jgi:hypothetical protein